MYRHVYVVLYVYFRFFTVFFFFFFLVVNSCHVDFNWLAARLSLNWIGRVLLCKFVPVFTDEKFYKLQYILLVLY